MVNGVVDVYATEADGVLVVDYKSDSLEGRDPEERLAAKDPTVLRLGRKFVRVLWHEGSSTFGNGYHAFDIAEGRKE